MITSTLIFNSELFTDYLVYNDKSHSEYLVQVDHEDGTVKCDCPDFTYRRMNTEYGGARLDDKEHHCKHIREVLDGSK